MEADKTASAEKALFLERENHCRKLQRLITAVESEKSEVLSMKQQLVAIRQRMQEFADDEKKRIDIAQSVNEKVYFYLS